MRFAIDRASSAIEQQSSQFGAGLKQLITSQQVLTERLERQAGDEDSSAASPADHGKVLLQRLAKNSQLTSCMMGDGVPAMGSELIAQAKKLCKTKCKSNEKYLVNLYTPTLMDIIAEADPKLRLINSECYKWIKCKSKDPKCDLKPDLFVTHHSLVEFLPGYLNAPTCTIHRHFGKFANWSCRQSLTCIIDCKWKITDEGFGEKAKYLELTGAGCTNSNNELVKLKGMLFSIDEFWLIKSTGSRITEVQKCRWSTPGSRRILLNFFRDGIDSWAEGLNALCEELGQEVCDFSLQYQAPLAEAAVGDPVHECGVGCEAGSVADSSPDPVADESVSTLTGGSSDESAPVEEGADEDDDECDDDNEEDQKPRRRRPKITGPTALLGCGAHGRAFRLASGKALKVVTGPNCSDVEQEYLLMLQHFENQSTRPHVFPVVKGSYRKGVTSHNVPFAGYLLDQIGEKITKPVSLEVKDGLANALYALHSNNVTHGDPRIQNVLLLHGVVKFIDFRTAITVCTEARLRHDVITLFETIGGDVTAAQAIIEAYVTSPSLEGLREIIFLAPSK